MKITGRLKKAFIEPAWAGRCVISGLLYDDVRGRWPDGTQIWTSNVVLILGNYVFTRNSIYLVEDWYEA